MPHTVQSFSRSSLKEGTATKMPDDSTTLNHKQSLNRMKDIQEELDRLGAKKQRTREDDVTWAELTREFDELDEHRRNLERTADIQRVRDALSHTATARVGGGTPTGKSERGSAEDYDTDPLADPNSAEDFRNRNPWDLTEVRTYGRSQGEVSAELRARALSAIEKMTGANDKIRSTATHILETFDDSKATLARQCLATSSPEYIRAWSKMAMNREHSLSVAERAALERAMSLTDNAGGYLVPFQLDPTVIITSSGSLNDIRQIARQVVATGDIWHGVSSGAVSWSWDAEGTEVSDDSTAFAQPTVQIFKADGFVPITIEAMMDEQNVTQEVGRLLAEGRDTLEASAFAVGTGSGQPRGIVTALAAIGGASVVNSSTTDTLAAGDIYKVDGALPAKYRRNASWLSSRSFYNLIRQFDTAGGSQLWEHIGADVPSQLLGRGAYESEDMDGTITASSENYMTVYGDFRNYVIADRIGMTVEFIPHLFHTANNRPSGTRGWYAYYRVGADVVNGNGFRMLDVT
jgi:HK97 family phage major capsid protein